jgi:hypothetical protein
LRRPVKMRRVGGVRGRVASGKPAHGSPPVGR